MSETKDYSLLRPFDLEAAKRWEAICTRDGVPAQFISYQAHLDEAFRVIYTVEGWHRPVAANTDGQVNAYPSEYDLRMAPLCWVEGRPVYRGDTLYWFGEAYPVSGADVGRVFSVEHARLHAPSPAPAPEDLTWTPPKVKREGWVNVYPAFCSVPSRVANTSHAYETKEAADSANCCNAGRIACVRIEW